jgi:hypothetical protein
MQHLLDEIKFWEKTVKNEEEIVNVRMKWLEEWLINRENSKKCLANAKKAYENSLKLTKIEV